MFSFLRKEEPSLQLYGKLPLAKDYLRIGGGDGPGRAWRDWMDRVFSAPGEAGPIVARRFLVLSRSGPALQGTLWPSSDAGGLRPFPLALWVERRRAAVWPEGAHEPASLERWWAAIEALRLEADAFGDGAALLAGLRGRKVVAGETGTAPGEARRDAEPDLETWTRAAFAGGAAGLEQRLEVLLAPAAPATLTLPLSGAHARAPQVEAWLRVLLESGALDARGAGTLWLPPAEGWSEARRDAILFVPAVIDTRREDLVRDEPPGEGPMTGAGIAPGDPGTRDSLANALCGTLALVRARARGR